MYHKNKREYEMIHNTKLTIYFTSSLIWLAVFCTLYQHRSIENRFVYSQRDASVEIELTCLRFLYFLKSAPKSKFFKESVRYSRMCSGVNMTSVLGNINSLHKLMEEIPIGSRGGLFSKETPEPFFKQLIKKRKSSKDTKVDKHEKVTKAKCTKQRDFSSAMKSSEIEEHGSYIDMIETCEGEKALLISEFERRAAPKQQFKVPNVVHYVMFGDFKFTFLTYLSFLSVDKYLKPEYIFIHGNAQPYGTWWNQTLHTVKNIMFLQRQPKRQIFGRPIRIVNHSADIARYEIILDYGGIYLDTDVLVLKSFDDLRKWDLTLGRETDNTLANGIIIGRKNSLFIRLWLETYHTYFPGEWSDHSVHVPNDLALLYRHLIHVEEKHLIFPPWHVPHLMFEENIDWSQNYAMHIWKRRGPVPRDPMGIQKLKSTLGEVMRFVLYGNKTIFG